MVQVVSAVRAVTVTAELAVCKTVAVSEEQKIDKNIQIQHGKMYTIVSKISIIKKNRKEIKRFWFAMYTF